MFYIFHQASTESAELSQRRKKCKFLEMYGNKKTVLKMHLGDKDINPNNAFHCTIQEAV